MTGQDIHPQLARLDAGAAAAAPGGQRLEAGAVRFVPQPSMVFSKGETVHLLYSVRNGRPVRVADAAASQSSTPRAA